MNILEKIFKDNEYQNINRYEQILYEFLEESQISFLLDVNDIKSNFFTKFRLFHIDYIYTSIYINLYFNILSKYSYNMKQEIKDAMLYLGNLPDPNKNKQIIFKYLKSPVIQDISYDGKGTYTIYSEKYGKFIFTLASYYYKENNIIKGYIINEELPQRCHSHVYFLSKIFGNLYATTSLCPSFFLGEKYYHSYTYDMDENIIIDLCYNAIINKDLYYKIFNPDEISVILNRKVNEEYQIVEEKIKDLKDWEYLILIALYKQYLNSINYKGSLEEAPTLNKKLF